MDQNSILARAREVLDIEMEGLKALRDGLGDSFVELTKACCETLENNRKIIICGLGKSGHVGKKIAATLASTGSTSIFMHPVEAMHGDLGVIMEGDIVIAISYSGETDELLRVILPAKRLGVRIASFVGNTKSSLASLSDIVVSTEIPREACPFNLAPTTSSTAQLAIGDALAMVLLNVRKFTKENYGRLHPGGAIGRAVTMRVSDVMRARDRFAIVAPETTVRETLCKMTESRSGSAMVTDPSGKLLGIFTDGDFRRRADDMSILSRTMNDVMTKNPTSIRRDALAIEILKIIEKRKIDDIPVVDEKGNAVGIVDVQDLPGLKLL